MDQPGLLDGLEVHVVAAEAGADIAVEEKFPLGIFRQGDECQRCAGVTRQAQRADIHAIVGQGLHQEAAEAVLPGFPHQGALDAQPGQAHRDIGGSTPGSLMKGGCGYQIGAGGDRYEINQQLAYGDRVRHVGLIQVIG
jgi:hypothetical protein